MAKELIKGTSITLKDMDAVLLVSIKETIKLDLENKRIIHKQQVFHICCN